MKTTTLLLLGGGAAVLAYLWYSNSHSGASSQAQLPAPDSSYDATGANDLTAPQDSSDYGDGQGYDTPPGSFGPLPMLPPAYGYGGYGYGYGGYRPPQVAGPAQHPPYAQWARQHPALNAMLKNHPYLFARQHPLWWNWYRAHANS